MIRFEIRFRLFYNDGRAVERRKFVVTDDESVHGFSATSTDTWLCVDSGCIKARVTTTN